MEDSPVHPPALDRRFGALYTPPIVRPTRSGVDGDPVPGEDWAQPRSQRRSRGVTAIVAVAVSATVGLGGCAVYESELRSVPTISARDAKPHRCDESHEVFESLCFSIRDVQISVEARNGEQHVTWIGPLLPVFPVHGGETAQRLEIQLTFKPDEPYAFYPWAVSLQTAQGDTVGVSRVLATFHYDDGNIKTVELGRDERGAQTLFPRRSNRFLLTFEKYLAPEQEFSLTLHVVARDEAQVQTPAITFKKGKVSLFGAVP